MRLEYQWLTSHDYIAPKKKEQQQKMSLGDFMADSGMSTLAMSWHINGRPTLMSFAGRCGRS